MWNLLCTITSTTRRVRHDFTHTPTFTPGRHSDDVIAFGVDHSKRTSKMAGADDYQPRKSRADSLRNRRQAADVIDMR